MGLLVREERRAPNPVVPPGLFRERATIVLLVLSLLMGVAMFVLLFYVPLLLQGGIGLDAGRAGIVVTPMVVCITVGTITNTRVVTRVARPNLLLYAGFGLLAVSCVAIASAGASRGYVAFIAAMAMAGIGIGFVMPNLTVFVQQVAGNTRLGIATALIQSARMVGGMLGTAVAGTASRHLYRAALERALAARPGAIAGHWFAALEDPQTLMSTRAASAFVAQAERAGAGGDALLQIARAALVHALQTSLLAVALLMVAACVVVRLLPMISMTSTAAVAQPVTPE